MSSQDRLEHVLRDIHVMISKSEAYDTDRIIVSKKDIFSLIDRLNASVYEIMDDYELTRQSRDRALRENKKEGDKIIWDASRQAEDIYAASVLYTDEALNHLHGIMEYANDTIGQLYKDFGRSMREQQEMIRDNQLELKSQLQLLTDTEKYLKLIEERNREIERERAKRKGIKVLGSSMAHKAIKPEIKINEAYFRKAGIPLEPETDLPDEEMEPLPDEGVIESTLKKVAEDVRQEVLEDSSEEAEDSRPDTEEPDLIYQEENEEKPEPDYDFKEPETQDEMYEAAQQLERKKQIEDSIKVNLDAEYFKQKNSGTNNLYGEYANQKSNGIRNPETEHTEQKNGIINNAEPETVHTEPNSGMTGQRNMDTGYEDRMEEQHEPRHGKTSLLDKLMGKKKSF